MLHKAEEETDHKATEQHEDNIHWRLAVCDICVCKYNDISSLEKHFLSSRHRKQLDKVKSNGMEPDALVCHSSYLLLKQGFEYSSSVTVVLVHLALVYYKMYLHHGM